MKLPFSRARRLAPNQSGTVAVEFALLAPLMITLFLCCLEVTNLVMAYLKLNAAVQTAADLVAQQKTTQSIANITDYANAAKDTMAPLPTAGLNVAFVSMVWVAGVPSMSPGPANGGWHQEVGGAAITAPDVIARRVCSGTNAAGTTVTALCPNGDSVIIVQGTYAYSSPFSWLIPGNFNFVDIAITRPRFVTVVPHA